MVFWEVPLRVMEALGVIHLRGSTTWVVELDENGDIMSQEVESRTF